MTEQDLNREEDALRDQIGDLPPEMRKRYYELEQRAIRDPDTYAVLNYFFVCGLHHFYLGKGLQGLMNLAAVLIGLLFWENYGFILVALVFIIELPQLFRSQRIVRKHNIAIMREVLEEVRGGY